MKKKNLKMKYELYFNVLTIQNYHHKQLKILFFR